MVAQLAPRFAPVRSWSIAREDTPGFGVTVTVSDGFEPNRRRKGSTRRREWGQRVLDLFQPLKAAAQGGPIRHLIFEATAGDRTTWCQAVAWALSEAGKTGLLAYGGRVEFPPNTFEPHYVKIMSSWPGLVDVHLCVTTKDMKMVCARGGRYLWVSIVLVVNGHGHRDAAWYGSQSPQAVIVPESGIEPLVAAIERRMQQEVWDGARVVIAELWLFGHGDAGQMQAGLETWVRQPPTPPPPQDETEYYYGGLTDTITEHYAAPPDRRYYMPLNPDSVKLKAPVLGRLRRWFERGAKVFLTGCNTGADKSLGQALSLVWPGVEVWSAALTQSAGVFDLHGPAVVCRNGSARWVNLDQMDWDQVDPSWCSEVFGERTCETKFPSRQ